MSDQPFTIGIEEEYLLVNRDTLELSEAPERMMEDCREVLGDQVAPEFLRCQIEVGSKVCADIAEARADLSRLRREIGRIAAEYGLRPIAAACHPTAEWSQQTHRDRERYNALHEDLAAVGERMLICGMHVHVGIPGEDERIDLMNQASYFLPHLLALSTSSPFWRGKDTGLASYRIGVFDNLPRTGLPPRLDSWAAYRRAVDTIVATGMIEDASKIWWDMRPSDAYPTLETRICDTCPRLDHSLALAATIQSIFRMLWRLRGQNQRWRIYETFLIAENRWRAQRYGIDEGLIDLGRGEVVPLSDLVEELIALVSEDAQVLGCAGYLGTLREMARESSATRQRRVFAEAIENGANEREAFRSVTSSLVEEFGMDVAEAG